MARFLVAMVLFLAAAGADALVVFSVTNLNDSGTGSLRDAIGQANAAPGPDTISFDVTGTIVLTTGELRITGPLTIVGPGRFDLTIDGNGASRIFHITDTTPGACPGTTGPADFPVTISGMTLANGRAGDGLPGGGIMAFHTLALDQVTVRDSSANQGGGIAFGTQYDRQTLTITNSTISNNTATTTGGSPGFAYSGGGLFGGPVCGLNTPPGVIFAPPSTVTISNSVLSGNVVQPGPLWALGGGAAFFGDIQGMFTDSQIIGNTLGAPTGQLVNHGGAVFGDGMRSLRLERTEISGNSGTMGGGIALEMNIPINGHLGMTTLRAINSTIADNNVTRTGATGAGAYLFGNVESHFHNSTIYNNVAPAGAVAGVAINTGAGVPPPSLQFVSTINAANDPNAFDLGSNVIMIPSATVQASNSLFQHICPTCNMSLAGTGNLINVFPALTGLGYNGATTRTYAIEAGSMVIGAGSNPLNLTTDQRGAPFPRVVNGKVDMGAFAGVVPSDFFAFNLQGLFYAAPAGVESGHGVNVNQQGSTIFGTWYTYFLDRAPIWYVFAATRDPDGRYRGTIFTGMGPPFDNFDPSKVVPLQAGTATVSVLGPNDIVFEYGLEYTPPVPIDAQHAGAPAKAGIKVHQSKLLTREVFNYPLPTCTSTAPVDPATLANYQDLWWAFPAGSESGWGLNLTHQGDVIFGAWFTFGANGQPLWMVFAASKTAPNIYSGNVYSGTGPPFNSVPFDPSKVHGTQVGTATLTFADGNRGTFAYNVFGVSQSKEITREVFGTPANACQ